MWYLTIFMLVPALTISLHWVCHGTPNATNPKDKQAGLKEAKSCDGGNETANYCQAK